MTTCEKYFIVMKIMTLKKKQSYKYVSLLINYDLIFLWFSACFTTVKIPPASLHHPKYTFIFIHFNYILNVIEALLID